MAHTKWCAQIVAPTIASDTGALNTADVDAENLRELALKNAKGTESTGDDGSAGPSNKQVSLSIRRSLLPL